MTPAISIVIRTFNEEKHLGNLLAAIEQQTRKDVEVLVVDSGSQDRTVAIARAHRVNLIEIESRDFTFGYSLNIGCAAAKGKYLIFVSAHVLPVDTRWLEHLMAPFEDKKVAMVSGRQMGDPDAKFSEKRDLADLFGNISIQLPDIPEYAHNANSAIRRELWVQHPFDEYLFGLEDIDWARHAVQRGYAVRYAPKAAVYHIHREGSAQIYGRYRREAVAAFRIGLPYPPQARTNVLWALWRFLGDLLCSFPQWSPVRLREIAVFRYQQWKGTWRGWYRDRAVDVDRKKYNIVDAPENKAVLIRGTHQAAFEKVSIPPLKPGDLLIEVAYVGICRTDLEVYEGTLGYYRDGIARYPIVPGHEFSGIIAQIGASTKYREKYKVGETVVGECILSRDPSSRKEVGVINHNGAYSRFVVIPGAFVHKVPPGVDAKVAAMTEPLAVVLRALRRIDSRLATPSSVAVIGAGPIGNLCTQVLAARGHTVSVFDRRRERTELLEIIADKVSITPKDLSTFDVIIEATGSKEALEHILRDTKSDATILLLGFPYGETLYNFEDVVGKEKHIIGSVGADREDFVQALQLLPTLHIEPFVQTIFPLHEFKKAWELHASGKHLKVILKP